jgi:hypothetical protein
MYTIETLKQINARYECDHFISRFDVEMANAYVELIERSRSIFIPQAGDRVRYTNEYGEYYGHAHIERVADGEAYICEVPYTPFIWKHGDSIECSTSGGAWSYLPIGEFKYLGKEPKTFCDWGTCGACAKGAVEFEAEVSVWEYTSPDNRYAPYTTKDYRREFIRYVVDEFGNPTNGSDYRYFGDGIAFKTDEDYQAWLRTYRGIELQGGWENQRVVFLYREKQYYITKDEWDALDYPIDTRMCNGIVFVKVQYDDENHCIHTYRYTNDGSANWRTHKPYMIARQEMEIY